jgi:tRNA A37 threonylcarbamoyladenosine dehydratase
MKEQFSRTENLLGQGSTERLKHCRVAVFGVGGVGSFTVEALARAGVGAIDLIDSDKVSESNINRQIIALKSTVGQLKVNVAEKRIKDINPECEVTVFPVFYSEETAESFDFSKYDYIVDAIDTVSAKIDIICRAKTLGVPIISSMGTGNKLDPTAFKVTDIYKTKSCPLARVMRSNLKKQGIKDLKVVFSEEMPKQTISTDSKTDGKRAPASVPFVPSVAGLIIAGEVIKDLLR